MSKPGDVGIVGVVPGGAGNVDVNIAGDETVGTVGGLNGEETPGPYPIPEVVDEDGELICDETPGPYPIPIPVDAEGELICDEMVGPYPIPCGTVIPDTAGAVGAGGRLVEVSGGTASGRDPLVVVVGGASGTAP